MRDANETTVLLRGGAAAPRGPCLVMLAGPDLARRIDLAEGELTLGRDEGCSVVLPVGGVSRRHCVIRRAGDGLWLRDLGSTNGTRRNGEPIASQCEVPLHPGDLITVAGAIFKLLDGEGPEAEYHERVYRALTLDALTGVRNRRAFHDALSAEIARSRRHQHELSLLLLDVDRFKEVNDRHGHPCGDLVLQRIAALLLRSQRRENCTARFGGDEFALLLSETPLGGAMICAERMRGAIECEEILFAGERVEVTVSIGAATAPPETCRPDDLIAAADAALYRAKGAGRNRVSR